MTGLPTTAKRTRTMLGESIERMRDVEDPSIADLNRMSNTNPHNPFSHLLFKLRGVPGKLLLFYQDSMIRNGKYRQPEHISIILRHQIKRNRPWYGVNSGPNTVFSVTFRVPIDESIGQDKRAKDNRPKFPAFSLISKRKAAGQTNCSPMVYTAYKRKKKRQYKSNVNIPGPKSPEDLLYHLKFVDKVSVKYPSRYPLYTGPNT